MQEQAQPPGAAAHAQPYLPYQPQAGEGASYHHETPLPAMAAPAPPLAVQPAPRLTPEEARRIAQAAARRASESAAGRSQQDWTWSKS